ncbi:MAG: hypothetical protein CO186_06180 [Zetaproteobacteria bacterium CG_4_9_14_3_um_filter_49_83]|nr:MAG: hypothetical protein AUJ56_12600 [Zetaproteobacteria bacterium CG1_02_49_23]PIQ34339.1 MAG: hypothetical protein COW62_02215 [Zetaproteobacteria bacterium CG17_big_fil_post_rev_8_21_14_2_50_50_13]PIV29902.1 MAG: hypothetical protein COS35_09520 [Zetaproteobacteria bacterium CG02_land_8_20_14_3_00_50_9]PIY56149.1 MAG: hypothetical protein COZ00_05690 [Zetaproteobacteria bacterium CG_4_10_14_0_8_um_filter_49_80]PJA35374.1 MAG: hypothetical protein CO186_06180 [Zetaproteobacteria bacterium
MLFKHFNFSLFKPTAACLLLLAANLAPTKLIADDMVRLNIAAFETRVAGFSFDAIITGTYADLFNNVKGKADIIYLTRTPVLLNGDVLNIQIDALRMASNNKLSNEGLNCQIIFDNQSDEASQFYSISGLCTMLEATDTGTNKIKAYIKRTMLSDANYNMNVWIKIYEDKVQGMAIYADVDPK